MVRVWLILGLLVVILAIYTLVDAAMFPRERIRGLPRWAWILVIFIPVIGPLLWLIVGRGGRRSSRPVGRSLAPDDDLDFLKGLELKATQEQRIRQIEQELAELDKPDNGGKPPADPGDGDQPGRRDA